MGERKEINFLVLFIMQNFMFIISFPCPSRAYLIAPRHVLHGDLGRLRIAAVCHPLKRMYFIYQNKNEERSDDTLNGASKIVFYLHFELEKLSIPFRTFLLPAYSPLHFHFLPPPLFPLPLP